MYVTFSIVTVSDVCIYVYKELGIVFIGRKKKNGIENSVKYPFGSTDLNGHVCIEPVRTNISTVAICDAILETIGNIL